MKNKKIKGFESIAPKALIIVMSVVYILSSLNLKIDSTLHSIAHIIEKPTQIISHKNTPLAHETPQNTHHKTSVTSHSHHFIDLVQELLNGSDTKDTPQDKTLKVLKISKNSKIREKYTYEHIWVSLSEVKNNFDLRNNKISKGFLEEQEKPPKSV